MSDNTVSHKLSHHQSSFSHFRAVPRAPLEQRVKDSLAQQQESAQLQPLQVSPSSQSARNTAMLMSCLCSGSCSGPQTGVPGQNICFNGELGHSYGACCPDANTGSTSVQCLPDLSGGSSDRQDRFCMQYNIPEGGSCGTTAAQVGLNLGTYIGNEFSILELCWTVRHWDELCKRSVLHRTCSP